MRLERSDEIPGAARGMGARITFRGTAGVSWTLRPGPGLSYVAGLAELRSALSRAGWTWLTAMAGAPCITFAGYHAACQGIHRAEGGYHLPARAARQYRCPDHGG